MGLISRQSSEAGTLTNTYNRLGQLEDYSDGTGNTAKYTYYGPEDDNLLKELKDSHTETREGKPLESYQRYTYAETTKALSKLEDSAAGTFTGTYDAEGVLESETYPNGMCAEYQYASTGEATKVTYRKHHSGECGEAAEPNILFTDARLASIHGETLSQASSLATETYSYDTAGRLLEVRETPAGGDCTVRSYAYDEESNRTSLETEKSRGTECEITTPTVAAHNYDEGDRLADQGVVYEEFGDITTLPAADAGGANALETHYYVSGAVATQTQGSTKHEYQLDPEGRTSQTKTGSETVVSHYDASGEAVSWTSEGGGKATTRQIPGIDGTLAAIQTSSPTPEVQLQLHDLQGNIVAVIADSTSATELREKYNSTEYGEPDGKPPPRYAWLGAQNVASEFASGVITYGATSYVPQVGEALQDEPVVPPGLANGSGVGAPTDFEESPWVRETGEERGDEGPLLEAGREKAAAEAACRANPACGTRTVSATGAATELGFGGEVYASGITFGGAYCVFQPSVNAEYALEDGTVSLTFTTRWECKNGKKITINAAWNWYGVVPSSIYFTTKAVHGGVIVTEIPEALGEPVPQTPVGMCVAATYKGKKETYCWKFGEV